MKKILRPLLIIFSLFFLISTVMKNQKNFHTHMKSMVSCNEGNLCSLTYDLPDFINGQGFQAVSDDDNTQYSDDSVDYCFKLTRVMQLFMALSFILPAAKGLTSAHNKFSEITLRNSTVF